MASKEPPVRIRLLGEQNFQEITEVWEASVRATHDFIPEDYILELRDLIPREYLPQLEVWGYCARLGELLSRNEEMSPAPEIEDQSSQGEAKERILGFVGLSGKRIEMLFVDPEALGRGLGSQLLRFAVETHGARELDVNEQNPKALGFYKKMGFEVVGRSAEDPFGRPYPLLLMRLKEGGQA